MGEYQSSVLDLLKAKEPLEELCLSTAHSSLSVKGRWQQCSGLGGRKLSSGRLFWSRAAPLRRLHKDKVSGKEVFSLPHIQPTGRIISHHVPWILPRWINDLIRVFVEMCTCCVFFLPARTCFALYKSLFSCLQVHRLGSNLPKTEADAEMLISWLLHLSQLLPVELSREKTVRKRRDFTIRDSGRGGRCGDVSSKKL